MNQIWTAEDPIASAARQWVERRFQKDRRAACLRDRSAAEAVWQELGELGMLGLAAPESAGGIDATAAQIAAVAEALGRGGMTEPWTPVAVTAATLLREIGETAGLAQLAEGVSRPVVAWFEPERRWAMDPQSVKLDADGRLTGTKTVIWGADAADKLLVTARDTSGGSALVSVPAAAAQVQAYRTWDGGDAAEARFDGVQATPLAKGARVERALARARDMTLLALSAEAVGAMERAISLTLDHLRVRQQFGRPLATNQALRHRLAEAWGEMELSRALITRVARDFDTVSDGDRARLAAAAKAQAGAAARCVANEAVQMHGAIGVTDEAEVSVLYRRLVAIDLQFGPVSVQLARFRGAA
ncbi:MAG: acyl-CoA dehydrogenase family protein [Pararhodobacter sp.]